MFIMALLWLDSAIPLAALGAPMWYTIFFGLATLMGIWAALSKDEGPTEQQVTELLNYEIAEKWWGRSYNCY